MEIELNFRLDRNGRTANSQSDPEEQPSENQAEVNYQSKTIMTSLAVQPNDAEYTAWMDDLLFDCEISDCGLMPRTFWVPAQGMKPRCQLEQLALDVFNHHVPKDLDYDPLTSGAEWWAQLRPSPEGTGRYSMHDEQPDALSETGISFHWDKDEDLRLLMGGTTYLHPHLSTVTYLTDIGSPTLALNYRVEPLTGEWLDAPDSGVEGYVSWPKTGKHLSFDGRYLHAAPADLMEPGSLDKQLEIPPGNEGDPQMLKKLKRRYRRVTFLVNVWLNYKPFNVAEFPETMIDKMSGTDEAKRKHLQFHTDTTLKECAPTVAQVSSKDGEKSANEVFRWPMGDCDSTEFIEAKLPIDTIRGQSKEGGNVQIHWENAKESEKSGVCLFHDVPESKKRENDETSSSPRVRQKVEE